MNAKEKQVERLLATAHQICWDLGRHDVCTGMISALNCLRRLSPRPLSDNGDDDELNRAEEAVAHGVSVSELIK
jgi:hypothetical protein